MFETEIATYNAQLPKLIESAGKFVLIKGDKIVNVFDEYSDALRKGYETFEDGIFFVKKIAPAEQVLHFSRSLHTECL